jgi:hypothetical protein
MTLGHSLESVTNRGEHVRNWPKTKQTERIELGTQGQKGVPWRTDPAIAENACFATVHGRVQSYWSGNVTYPKKGYTEGQVGHLDGYAARDRDMD